ncbi:restriction endonuclease subunit S [Escherichia coli]|uniref:restriction endonuclease subunit S n=1 Tax=Escherichia coli TaxID=562 RepID=UPI000DCCC888|nr:restriction endonuclease subunit S [Escherichia coli]EGI9634712.1 restriction endonuclease subunit S [Escherichia coli]EHR7939293.1 restriction endonuclease subunit S [Escherichia coli]EHR9178755.1 restriction endonuclease subunit S [Escherichia coli]EHS5724890.1 restriction endonuclease subunit S [Escherichia coli]EJK7732389.1 restriction endonuclease subunit S [Escherichia coli]
MNDNVKQFFPRLRFQSFKASGPWEFQPLGKLAKRSVRKNVDGKITRVLTNSAEYGVVDQRDFFEKDIANQSNLEGYYLVEEGSYVYNPRISTMAPVGPISKNKIGLGVISPLYTVFKFNSKNNDFYTHYFKSTHWHHYMRQVSSTGVRHDRMNISNNAFMELPLPVSTPEEQQKIANCLSSLDALLTAEVQKLDALKKYKKGLLQQLFPREGETLPKLRFPNFQGTTEWKICPLGDFIEEYRKKSTYQDEYDVLTSARNGLIKQREYYDNERITERNNIGFNIIPVNYITYRSRSDDRRFYFNENNLGITGIISTYYPVFRINKGINKFFIELLAQYAEYVGKHSVGTSQTVLSLNELRRIKLPIPTEAEQQDIANCLYSFDNLIVAQAQKVKTLKTFKKGLLQQIFPKVNEVIL